MQTETAANLLDAVGVDYHEHCMIECPECHMPMRPVGIPQHAFKCRRPDTSHIEPTYTGPALGTPELDALLLVAGQRWLQDAAHSSKRDVAKNLRYDSFEENSGGWISGRLGLMFQSPLAGHALARAIAEVGKA